MTEPGRSASVPGSFRDPDGFMFRKDGVLYRQVNRSCAEDFRLLMESGLYGELTGKGLLAGHEEASIEPPDPASCWKIIRPSEIPFVSYPYEWCFSQMKAAALLTLLIQKTSLKYGMSLKDGSAYNVQFRGASPVFIDTLSFEAYKEGAPWAAYGQFCRHFLAPLALMSGRDARLLQLLRVHLDGIPLDLAASLLPIRARFKPSLFIHLCLHAAAERRYAGRSIKGRSAAVSQRALMGLIDSLESAVRALSWTPRSSGWAGYYASTNYSALAFSAKQRLVKEFLAETRPSLVFDMGANTGEFSRLCLKAGARTVAFDMDPAAVEKNFLASAKSREEGLLPLLLDLANPSPALGWANAERMSLMQRPRPDLVLALALAHHLALSNNVPLAALAAFFSGLSDGLVIEFVPKSDSQVRRMLSMREDVFGEYDQGHFDAAFLKHFEIRRKERLPESERTLYLLKRRGTVT